MIILPKKSPNVLASDDPNEGYRIVTSSADSGNITKILADLAYLSARIDKEVTDRGQGDSTINASLTSAISSASAAHGQMISRIGAEEERRETDDMALGTRISEESSSRSSADTALGTRITTETSERRSANSALQAAIDAEVTARTNADNTLTAKLNKLDLSVHLSAEYMQQEFDRRSDELDAADDYLSGEIDALADKLATNGEYSAFEVTIDAEIDSEHLYIRSATEKVDSDVIVDWGDGARTRLKDLSDDDYYHSPKDQIESENFGNGEYNVIVSHTYAASGKYIVKIYGRSYWGLMLGSYLNADGTATSWYPNPISRILDTDLPMASNVTDLASFCVNALRLTSVRIPCYFSCNSVINWSNTFQGCKNLVSFKTSKSKIFTRRIYSASSMFSGCNNMVTCELAVPSGHSRRDTAMNHMFNGCTKLSTNIANLLPNTGFHGKGLEMKGTFYGCAAITGNLDSYKWMLWEDWDKKWFDTTNCFRNSSLSAQAPTTWGGTLPAPVSPLQQLSADLDNVKSLLTILDEKIDNKQASLAGKDYGTISDVDSTMNALSAIITDMEGRIRVDFDAED